MGTVELVVMLGMIALNSLFAAYEIALAAVSQSRLRVLAAEGHAGAPAAVYMKENVEASLAAIQLGITLFAAVAAATGGASAEEEIAPWLASRYRLSPGLAEFLAVAAVVAPLTAVSIVVGELVPKVFALRNQEWVCLKLSPAMRGFTRIVWPAVWLFETCTTAITDWSQRWLGKGGIGRDESAEMQELRAVAAMARTSRLIGHREEGIILGAARLASRPLREILVPAEAISTLPLDASLADALVTAHLDMHTRFPVTEVAGDPARIVGYVNVKDLLAAPRLSPGERSLRGVVRQLPSFQADDSISGCLERLLRDGAHIAVVWEGGKVAGMVTLEDIVEELLGDIKDEYDRAPSRVSPAGAGWVVGGGTPLVRLQEATGIDLEADPPPRGASTLGDWVNGHLGRPATGGDVVERGGVRVAVRKLRRKRLYEAQLSGAEHPGAPPAS